MTQQRIIKANDFKAENIIFSEPQLDKNEKPVIYINYKYPNGDIAAPKILSPKMNLPFGVSAMIGDKPSKIGASPITTDSLQFSFMEKGSPFQKELEKFDERLLDLAANNAKFLGLPNLNGNLEATKELISEAFTGCVKFSKDKKTKEINEAYPPTFKGKLYKDKETNSTYNSVTFYNGTSKTPSIVTVDTISEFIPKRSQGVAVMSCNKMWAISKGCGVAWIPSSVKIYPNMDTDEYPFEDESDINEPSVDVQTITKNIEKINVSEDEDSEDEIIQDENDELDEPVTSIVSEKIEPITVVAPKTTSRRKKAI